MSIAEDRHTIYYITIFHKNGIAFVSSLPGDVVFSSPDIKQQDKQQTPCYHIISKSLSGNSLNTGHNLSSASSVWQWDSLPSFWEVTGFGGKHISTTSTRKRTGFTAWLYLLVFGITSGIVLLSIFRQVKRAATTNPAEVIKAE